jgi:hypothetical protein
MSYQANFTISYCTLTLPFFCIKSFVSPSVIGFLYLAKHLFSFLAFISLISFVIGLRLYYQYFFYLYFIVYSVCFIWGFWFYYIFLDYLRIIGFTLVFHSAWDWFSWKILEFLSENTVLLTDPLNYAGSLKYF